MRPHRLPGQRRFARICGSSADRRRPLPLAGQLPTPLAANVRTVSTWTLGVQHVFKNNYTFEVRYVGTSGVHLWNQTRLNIFPLVSPTNYIPTFFTMPSAATFASLTKTLADVKSYIVPGGTAADTTRTILPSYGSDANIVGYSPQANSTYQRAALAVEPALLQRVGFHCSLHLEPPGGRCYGDQFLDLSDAAPRPGFPEPQGGLGHFRSRPPAALHVHADL